MWRAASSADLIIKKGLVITDTSNHERHPWLGIHFVWATHRVPVITRTPLVTRPLDSVQHPHTHPYGAIQLRNFVFVLYRATPSDGCVVRHTRPRACRGARHRSTRTPQGRVWHQRRSGQVPSQIGEDCWVRSEEAATLEEGIAASQPGASPGRRPAASPFPSAQKPGRQAASQGQAGRRRPASRRRRAPRAPLVQLHNEYLLQPAVDLVLASIHVLVGILYSR